MDQDRTTANADNGKRRRRLCPGLGLSGKLLLLTTVFVMVAEILIYVPSIANFRIMWLKDRLAAAHTAALVLDAAPSGMVPESLAQQILDSIGAKSVVMKTEQQRRLLVTSKFSPDVVDQEVDVRDLQPMQAIIDAFKTLFISRSGDLVRAVGPAPRGGEFVEIVVEDGPLRYAMLEYSRNILLLSLVISIITAALVYLALLLLFVRPMHRITSNMMAFHRDPEAPGGIIVPSRRSDEIGVAERELASMQQDLVSMLKEKSRLASLGLAVSKINHDLRNLLSSAQLFSDRLAGLPDPRVQQFAPKLMRALERAIAYCQSTLSYGRAQEPPPDRHPVLLDHVVEEVRETLGLNGAIGWIAAVERGLVVDADHDQLLRILLNLTRNAVQALETRAPNDAMRDQVRVTGRREGAVALIEVSDTGPGLSPKARAHLFEAFQASTRAGGSGLGLAIAAELVRAHGGEIKLIDGTIGATFRFTIPDRAVDLRTWRREAHG
ncbi:MAG: HAMP domain-containing histidine kinase [Xanthobacteraceae bacterium]|nr:HAMP domain-containing histidine kinase [Xanthobacteraceae bacterium]